MPAALPRVLVAEDHPVFRQGVLQSIRRVLGREVELLETDTHSATCAAVERVGLNWRVLILDLQLPGGDGLEVIRRARKIHPQTPIMVCTMADETLVGPIVVEAGATAFVSKSSTRRELETALRAVLEGRAWYPPRLQLWVNQRGQANRRAGGGYTLLSDREKQVLTEFSRGCSQKEIAARLGISPSSVGTHRTRILQKLGLRTTGELLRYAAELRVSGSSGSPWGMGAVEPFSRRIGTATGG